MAKDNSVSQWFGKNLAELLAEKIVVVYKDFDSHSYIKEIEDHCTGFSYTQRVNLHAEILRTYLPSEYPQAIKILINILGDENPNQTGMFTNFYWIMPMSKFIEKYGLDDFEISIKAIEEVTKRSTGEYAIRPFIRKYPQQTLTIMTEWSKSKNFHLRRLASEGVRPKLPWATKLDLFIDNPQPVFKILHNLMEDDIKFVQKSVANNLTDYLKVNKAAATEFINRYSSSKNPHTQWIIKHATRKITI